MRLGEAIHKAVELRGADYVYETQGGDCAYRYNSGEPACLLGTALDIMGLLPPLSALNQANHAGFDGLVYKLGIQNHFTEDEITAGVAAQESQDADSPWGVAEQDYLEALER